MMRRRALMSLLTCLALAGCGGSSGAGELAGKGRELISCAIGPGAEWSEDCPVERDGELLTVRHADGDRKSVEEGKSVSVRVDLGGRSIIKKKKRNNIKKYTYNYK